MDITSFSYQKKLSIQQFISKTNKNVVLWSQARMRIEIEMLFGHW